VCLFHYCCCAKTNAFLASLGGVGNTVSQIPRDAAGETDLPGRLGGAAALGGARVGAGDLSVADAGFAVVAAAAAAAALGMFAPRLSTPRALHMCDLDKKYVP
jgi:hypothetical protein